MLSAQRVERLRQALLAERARLAQELADVAASAEVSAGPGNHPAEDATAAFDQAAMVSLRRGEERALAQVDEALHRMAAGSYGVCDRCGDQIDFARLKALPYATLCMDCQKLVEH